MGQMVTTDLIQASISTNTQRAYQHAMKKLETWRGERTMDDTVLAEYITHLHVQGKAPATISLVVAAVKWYTKYHGERTIVGAMTECTLAGIRRKGKDRGRGQVALNPDLSGWTVSTGRTWSRFVRSPNQQGRYPA